MVTAKLHRDELGRRIEDGEPGADIVQWLNGIPAVQEILQEQFGGRAITEKNLSDWRNSGHAEWLRQEQALEVAARLTERSDGLAETAGGKSLSDRFACVLAAELASLAMELLEKETDLEKRWERLCQVHQQLSRLRHDDHRAEQMALKREQWEHERESEQEQKEERAQQAHKARLMDIVMSPLRKQMVAEGFGGGEYGRQQAELLQRIKLDLPIDDLLQQMPAEKRNGVTPDTKPSSENGNESGLMKPNEA
jgi:hypothetical protein